MSVPLILLMAIPPAAAATVLLACAANPRIGDAYRLRLLAKGDDPADAPTIRIPNRDIHGHLLDRLFAHKSASQRGHTHARRTFLYYNRPANEHQECIDTDHPHYAELAKATLRTLSVPREEIVATARRCTHQVLEDVWRAGTTSRVLRLTDLTVPIASRLMFELVFRAAPSQEQIALIGRSASDTTKNFKGIRHSKNISTKLELLGLLQAKVTEYGGCPRIFGHESALDTNSRAKHLQGVFFSKGVNQLSEFACHTVLAASRHPHVVERVIERDARYLDHVLSETLRLYPQHATIQRLVVDDVPLSPTVTIPRGTQLLVDISRHQRMGHTEPDAFIPERWEHHSRADSGFVVFGKGQRKCPAERFSRTAGAVIVQELLSSFAVHAPIRHTRALEGGGLCCLVPLGSAGTPGIGFKKMLVWTRDHAERLAFGAAQLICFSLAARAVRRLPRGTDSNNFPNPT
ncbi:cytochrome P450 [Streptomyces lunaelactis]|uniref:cytochrome P450 n=1 Tax=Streptomyces lunaelactis TaxID=1535768 RepID=UPI001585A806|nr:cytochrome P450 [Streptomyces lunaelactis]NUL03039.1 cytochrome P450 [Streptomyces lunaelactis]